MRCSEKYNAENYQSGLICSVFRTNGPDCTAGGPSSKFDKMLCVGPGISGPFEVERFISEIPIMYIHHWEMDDGTKSYFVSPSSNPHEYMFGGNFVYTSDSRFPSNNAIRIHDRMERGR